MKKEELVWLSKYIKDVKIMKIISERSDDFIEILMNYINLCSGNINVDIINKIVNADTDKKSALIAKAASNNNFMLSKTRKYEEKMFLLDKIKNASTNLNAELISKIVYSLSINKRRTFSEQIIFIDKIDSITDEDLSKTIYNIVVNNNILRKRTFEDQLKIITLVKKSDTDFKKIYMQAVATDPFILRNYSPVQHISFLYKILEATTDGKVLHVSNYINLGIKKRSFYEQIKVIDEMLKSSTDNIAGYIEYVASNPDLLVYLDGENHKKLIKKINEANSEEKARCMTLVILNQHKVMRENISDILSIMEQINLFESDIKIACMDAFISKSDFLFRSNYVQQSMLIDIISTSDDEILKDFISMLESYNISSKVILSSKEFENSKVNKEMLYEKMKKYCAQANMVKIKSIFKKGN